MKKIISLLLVLLLALTSAVAVNAEGIKDIFGGTSQRGDYTVIASGTRGNIYWEDRSDDTFYVAPVSGTAALEPEQVYGGEWEGEEWYYNWYPWHYAGGEEPSDEVYFGGRGSGRGLEIKKLIVAEGITSIGNNAFQDLYAVEEIELPASLRTIGNRAFQQAGDELLSGVMMTMTIAENSQLEYIDEYAFSSFRGTVYGMPYDCEIEDNAFNSNHNPTILHPGEVDLWADWTYSTTGSSWDRTLTVTGTGDMPDGEPWTYTDPYYGDEYTYNFPWEREVDDYGAAQYTRIVVSGDVTSISDNAFPMYVDVSEIYLPDTLESIGNYAFREMADEIYKINSSSNIASAPNNTIVFPSGLKTIGDFAFASFTSQGVTPGSITFPSGLEYIGHSAFMNYTGDVILGPNTEYEIDAFSSANSVTGGIPIAPQPHSGVYNGLAWNLTAEGALTISNATGNETASQGSWLDYKYQITSVTVSNGVELLPENAFYGVTNLTSATLSNTLARVPSGAFVGTGLTSIVVPSSVSCIDEGAFGNCPLTSVTLNNGLLKIGDNAFGGCSSLESITIPNSVAAIGSDAFEFSNIRNVTLPASVIYSGLDASDYFLYVQSYASPGTSVTADYTRSATDVTVTFNANNGTGDTIEVPLTASGVPTLPDNFYDTIRSWTKPNATLYGFTTSPNNYPIGVGYYRDKITNWAIDEDWRLCQNLTLYAVWAEGADLTVLPQAEQNYVDTPVTGYEDTKEGTVNGNSATWVKQSAKWTNEEKTEAELRVDFAYLSNSSFRSRDIVFVVDTSYSMVHYVDDSPSGQTSTHFGSDVFNNLDYAQYTIKAIANSALADGLNNRVACVQFADTVEQVDGFVGAGDNEYLWYLDGVNGSNNFLTNNDEEETGFALNRGMLAAENLIMSRDDKSRDPIIIILTDGGGTSAISVAEPSAPINRVDTDSSEVIGPRIKSEGITVAALCFTHSSLSSHYPSFYAYQSGKLRDYCDEEYAVNAFDGKNGCDALLKALKVGAKREYDLEVNIDTNRFELADGATVAAYGGAASDDVTLNTTNNTIHWDVSEYDFGQNYYFTVPLELKRNATSRGAGVDTSYPMGTFPTSLEEDNNIAAVKNAGSGANVNPVASPELTRAGENDYILKFVNEQGNAEQTVYLSDVMTAGSTHTLTATALTASESRADVEDGAPVYGNNLFAGWFKTKAASQAGNTAPASAYGLTITANETFDMYDGADDNIITLYAGWVERGTVTVDGGDPNSAAYGAGSLSGFNLEGIQIKSKDIADNGVEKANWQGADHDGLRFITVYRNGMLTELDNLFKQADNPNYVAANDTNITYGYMVYAKHDLTPIQKLKTNTSGAVDVDCTREEGMNHKYFTNYRLSTLVVRYENTSATLADDLATLIEARAYIDYIDANGFARRGFDTYGDTANETMFAGGCRASFNQAYTALTRR